MATWLQKQRKLDLNGLAEEAGLRGASGMRKDDLVEALDKHIQANSTKLSSNSTFDSYFHGEPGASSEAETKTPKPPRMRRVTKASTDADTGTSLEAAASSAGALVARTPRAIERAVARNLPASPSAVTDLVERQADFVSGQVARYWEASGVTSFAESARETVSSVVGIQALFLLFESYGLLRALLPFQYAINLPGLKTSPYNLPDLYLMLTGGFWGPALLWTTTSLAIPVAVAWLFNLTIHASKRKIYTVDPLIYNVTKGIVSWMVYSQGLRFWGFASSATVLTVEAAVPGGWFGIVISSLVGILASLYEAILRK